MSAETTSPAARLVEVTERDYREAVRAEALAMRARAAAGVRLFAARREWCAEQNAARADGGAFLVACRDCLQAVPAHDGGHEFCSEVGEVADSRMVTCQYDPTPHPLDDECVSVTDALLVMYARCGGEPR